MKAGGDAAESPWLRYYRHARGRPPRPTLLAALARFAAEGRASGTAVDLGCGTGRDTLELLRHGWRVLAIDAEPAALDALRAREDLPEGAALETLRSRFEALETLPPADLVNAGFSLPFCDPRAFPSVWRLVRAALPPGGRFCGQLFGERDSWAGETVALGPAALAELCAGWQVESLEVEEEDGVTPTGEAKHWHILHLLLRKSS